LQIECDVLYIQILPFFRSGLTSAAIAADGQSRPGDNRIITVVACDTVGRKTFDDGVVATQNICPGTVENPVLTVTGKDPFPPAISAEWPSTPPQATVAGRFRFWRYLAQTGPEKPDHFRDPGRCPRNWQLLRESI